MPDGLVGEDVHVESAAALEIIFLFATPGFYSRSLVVVAPILPPTRWQGRSCWRWRQDSACHDELGKLTWEAVVDRQGNSKMQSEEASRKTEGKELGGRRSGTSLGPICVESGVNVRESGMVMERRTSEPVEGHS